MRGQQDVEQDDLTEALKEFQKALDINKNSSLAHYRIAEVFFLQHNYQSAANAYRESLNGDGEPRWTESGATSAGHDFDLTGQRERATNEYRQALQTNDNTQDALDVARGYLRRRTTSVRQRQAGIRTASPTQSKAAERGGLFFCHAVGHQQNLERFSHSIGRDQVLELQGHFGLLLRQLAILEGVGELGFFPDPDQELRLRQQR